MIRKYVLWRNGHTPGPAHTAARLPAAFLGASAPAGTEQVTPDQFPVPTQLAIRRYLAQTGLGGEIVLTVDGDGVRLSMRPAPIAIADMELSVRSANCLRAASINTLDDLLTWTPSQLMGLPNFGKKCLNEICDLLRVMHCALPHDARVRTATQLDLRMGIEPASAPLASLMKLEELVRDSDLALTLRGCGWHFLSDMALHSTEAVVALAALDYEEEQLLRASLQTLGLMLPFDVPEWLTANVEALRKAFESELQSVAQYLPITTRCQSLFEEIASFIPSKYNADKRTVIAAFLGLGGKDPLTLDAAARVLPSSVTRERVRQIALPVTAGLQERGTQLPWLSRAVERLHQLAPCPAKEVEEILLNEGITGRPMTTAAVLSLVRRAGIESALRLEDGGLLTSSSSPLLAKVDRVARRMASQRGVADWKSIKEQYPEMFGTDLRDHLQGVAWLDAERRYFLYPERRNRLAKRLAKILTVSPHLKLSEAYRGVFRDDRVDRDSLPAELFHSFCRVWTWCVVEDDYIEALPSLPPVEPSNDDLLVLLLREAGRPLRRREVVALAAREGMREPGVQAALSYSNVIADSHGYFAVIGDPRLNERQAELLHEQKEEPAASSTSTETTTNSPPPMIPEFENSAQFVEQVLLTVMRRVKELNLQPQWSIAELRLNAADRERLLHWGRRTEWDFRRDDGNYRTPDGESVRKRAALGLTFLLFAAEVDRTFAQAGSISPAIEDAFGETQRTAFIVRPGVPKAALREAIEGATRRFGIRHGFEDSGQQVLWRTVGLQYGVRRSHLAHLPQMLSEPITALPIVLQLLLGPGGVNASPGFQAAWETLRAVRTGTLQETAAKEAFAANAWLGCFEPAELFLACQQRGSEHKGAEQRFEAEQSADAYEYFSAPRLCWEAQEIFLEYSLSRTPPEWLDISSIHFFCEEPFRKDRILVENGDWRLGTGPVRIPLTRRADSAFQFKLSRGGEVVYSETQVGVLDGECCFRFFCASGRMLRDAEDVPSGEDLLLLSDADVQLVGLPGGCAYQLVLMGTARVTRVPMNALAGLRVFGAGGTELWSGTRPSDRASASLVILAVIGGSRWGQRATLTLPEIDFAPKRLRLNNGDVVTVETFQGQHTLERTPALGRAQQGRLHGVRGTQRTSVAVQLLHRGPDSGAAVELRGQWSPLDGSQTLDGSLLATSRILAKAGTIATSQDLCWMEGSRPLSRLRSYGGSLLDVHGLGEPLRVCRGSYNNAEIELNVARAITNEGRLRLVQSEKLGHWTAVLPFDTPLEEAHRLWIWSANATAPAEVPRSLLTQSDFHLSWTVPTEAIIFGWALSFAGERIGSVCLQATLPAFVKHLAEGDWTTAAKWVRWWQVPVLDAGIGEAMKVLARSAPVQTLTAWVLPSAAPEDLHFDELQDESWAAAARELLWDWEPTAGEAVELVKALGIWTGDIAQDSQAVSSAAPSGLLARVSPVLLAQVAAGALPAMYSFPKQQLVTLLRLLLQAVDENAVNSSFRLKDVCERYAQGESRIDAEFILKSLVGAARAKLRGDLRRPMDTHNLQVAFHQPGLREIVTIALLDDLVESWRTERPAHDGT